ncbi:MAG: hypothetical protein QOK14_653 [Frankiaceae bacterium]|nr:hypothetical protein [Frankiaceae bacterium]
MSLNDTMSSTGTNDRPAWVLPGAMGLAATGVLLARRRRSKAAKARRSVVQKMKSAVGR